jgi:hypothetical protein
MNERTAEATTLASVDPLLVEALEEIGAAVGVRATDRLAAAHDASHYLLTPRAVVTARTAADVAAVFRAAKAQGAPVTFRSGGTSLSGQAGSDGVLIDTRHHFRGIEVLDDGARVRVQPGATVRATNTRLVRRKRKLGPDPASEIACTIGGVVANNSCSRAGRSSTPVPPTPTSVCAPRSPVSSTDSSGSVSGCGGTRSPSRRSPACTRSRTRWDTGSTPSWTSMSR